MKNPSYLTLLVLLFIGNSCFGQYFGPFDQHDNQFKTYYEPFKSEDEKIINAWYHYLVTYSEKEKRYILRTFQPEKRLMLTETRFLDKKLKIKDGKELRLIYSTYDTEIGNYVNDKEDGKWVQVDTSGKIKAIYHFLNGKKEGIGYRFYPNRQTERKYFYQNDIPIGRWQYYHENGKIEHEEKYLDGKLDGEVNYYDSTGILVVTKIYKKGDLEKTFKIKESAIEEDEIFQVSENAPHFIGNCKKKLNPEEFQECNQKEMYMFLGENIKYPVIAQKLNVSGRVFLRFVVEKDGTIGEIKLLTPLCESLEQEAIRVIKLMPKWEPGYEGGKPVRVFYTMPIVYKLD